MRDRLSDRDRERRPARDDSRGRMRDGDWISDRDRNDRGRDRINDPDRERERERGDRDRNNERDRDRDRDREMEKERERERERERDRDRRARMRAREADREPGEITTTSSRREDGEIDAREYRNAAPNNARNLTTDAGGRSSASSPQKKRKFNPIVWDLDDSKAGAGTQASTSQQQAGPPHPSSRFGPNSPNSPVSLKPSPPNADAIVSSSHKSSPATGRVSPQVRLRAKATVSPSVARVMGKHSSSSPSDRAMEMNRSSERVSTSPQAAAAVVNGKMASSPSSSSLSPSDDEERGRDLQSGDVHMQDVRRANGTPDSEDALEPGQVLDSPMLTSKQEEEDGGGTPAPITIARSRWAEDPHSPQQSSSPTLRAPKNARVQRSKSADSDEQGRGPSTSPEPGEFRQEKGSGNANKGSQDGEEYERELNKKELQELDEDSGSEDRELQQPELESEPEVEPIRNGPQHRAIDMLKGCRSVDEFEKLNKIDEGTYGVVFRARDKKTGELVALKKVKMEKEKGGFPMTSLREINVLLSFHHPSVVDVKEVVVGNMLDNIFMVMEYMEHDLKGLMETMKQPFSQSEVKCLMLQLFDGVKYLHDNWVLHRDLKTSNLLLNNRGELKICDFGLARQYGDPLKEYTHEVVTLWYRAPELLLGAKKYSTAIDMWSLGCIMAEFLAKEPLFPGKSVLDEIDKIFKTLGTPNEKIWPDFVKLPGVRCNFTKQPFNRLREKFPATAFAGRPTLSEKGFDLLNRLLTYDPLKRITAEEALDHEWFREVPLPKAKEFMPTFPARSEHDRRIRRLLKSPDPLEEQRKRELLKKPDLGGGGLFG